MISGAIKRFTQHVYDHDDLTNKGTLSHFTLESTVAFKANKLSVFASTTSAEFAGVISDETGSGALVFGTSPTISNPNLTGNIQKEPCNDSTTGIIKSKRGTLGAETVKNWIHDFRHQTGPKPDPNDPLTWGPRPAGLNIFIGEDSGNFTMGSTATQDFHASLNIGIGYLTGNSLQTGFGNTLFGFGAGRRINTGWGNWIAGYDAGSYVTTGNANFIAGYEAGKELTAGNYNLFAGQNAGRGITSGSSNLCMGIDSGRYLADGSTANQTPSGCVYIGNTSKSKQAGQSNEVVIGSGAIGNGSNTVTIGDSTITDCFITGALNLSSTMKITATVVTTKTSMDAYIPVVINGVTRYFRLFS